MRKQHKQPLLFALGVSILLHGLFFVPFYAENLTQTAQGNNQIILLETSPNKQASVKPQQTSKQTNTSAASLKPAKMNTQSVPINNSPQQTLTTQHNSQVLQTNNRGDLLDQSGKERTAQQQYEHIIYQHLLKNMESTAYAGSAVVNMKIISAGIAINVQVTQTSGQAGYKPWLLQKILSSNPMPPFPKDIQSNQIEMVISFKHETED